MTRKGASRSFHRYSGMTRPAKQKKRSRDIEFEFPFQDAACINECRDDGRCLKIQHQRQTDIHGRVSALRSFPERRLYNESPREIAALIVKSTNALQTEDKDKVHRISACLLWW